MDALIELSNSIIFWFTKLVRRCFQSGVIHVVELFTLDSLVLCSLRLGWLNIRNFSHFLRLFW